MDKCVACSVAINKEHPVLDDEAEAVKDVLSSLFSLTVFIYSYSSYVYNQAHAI